MINLKHIALAASLSTLASATAFASTGDPIIDFDSTAIPGANVGQLGAPYKFPYDDFLISDDGLTTVTQTDSDNNGVLSAGDGFSEFTVVSSSGFRLGGGLVPGLTSGVNVEYNLVTSITLGGFVVPLSGSFVKVVFTTGSGSMVYDESLGTPGLAPTAIATLGDPTVGSCDINLLATGNDPAGSCVLSFDFTSLFAGLFVSQTAGDLFGNATDRLRVDVNIDEVSGLAALLAGGYVGFGDTCGGGLALCTANISVTHNGSARHMLVPAPGTLALLGLGLLGFSRIRRNRA